MSDRGPSSDEDRPAPLNSSQLREYVRDVMDWTSYQAEAYVAVVREGPLEPKEIVAMTEVPQGRIYDVMGQLEGVAVNIQDHQPKRYEAQHPRSLLGEKQEDFNDKADAAIDHLEQQHEIQRERREQRHPAWVIPGIAGTKREILQGLNNAEDCVLLMEQDGRWIQSTEIRDFGRLVEQGIEVEIIGWSGWRETLEQIAEETDVKVWNHERVNSSFAIVDGGLVIMRVGRGTTGVKLEDEGSVDILHRAFEAIREEATEINVHA